MRIPLSFTHQGTQYTGYLHEVNASGTVYHIMIDDYYRGKIWYNEGWRIDSMMFSDLAEYFGSVVVAWEEGRH